MFKTTGILYIGRCERHADGQASSLSDDGGGDVSLHQGHLSDDGERYVVLGRRLVSVGLEGARMQVLDAAQVLAQLSELEGGCPGEDGFPVALHLMEECY